MCRRWILFFFFDLAVLRALIAPIFVRKFLSISLFMLIFILHMRGSNQKQAFAISLSVFLNHAYPKIDNKRSFCLSIVCAMWDAVVFSVIVFIYAIFTVFTYYGERKRERESGRCTYTQFYIATKINGTQLSAQCIHIYTGTQKKRSLNASKSIFT